MKKLLSLFVTAILAMVLLVGCVPLDDVDNGDKSGDGGQTPTITEYKKAGTYQVGVDIEPAEYLLVCTSSVSGYLEVTLEKNAVIGTANFLYNESFDNRRYVVVNSGEWIKFTGSKLYKLDATPDITKADDEGYPVGQYKVGRDIEAGEYLIIDTSYNSFNYVEQLLSPNASPMSSNFLFNKTFNYRHYVKVSDGQYISFNHGNLYSVAAAPEIITYSNGAYRSGQYKVGTDIPVGKHGISVVEGTSVYYEITTLPLCSILSDAFVKNGNLGTSTLVDVSDGQYIYIDSGAIYLTPQV